MKRTGWLDVAEAGGALSIQFLVVVCTVFGRAPARFLLRFVAAYYALTHRTARRASREFQERFHGKGNVTLRMVYAHILRFAQVSLDRLFLIRRQFDRFDVRTPGEKNFRKIRESKQGVIFLGAHLGSSEVLCSLAEQTDVPINIVGFFGNARMINNALQRLDPQGAPNLIEIEPRSVDFIFSVQERLKRGEHIAILGDRVGLAGDSVEVDFMGSPAPFPVGPFLLASVLDCPVYLVFGLYRGGNRYDVYCEPFAQKIELPRKTRKRAMREYAVRYAGRLDHYVRMAPDNWFNFFDFWSAR